MNKKRLWKKLVSLNLAIILLLSILSVSVYAETGGKDEAVQTASNEAEVFAEESNGSLITVTYMIDGKSIVDSNEYSYGDDEVYYASYLDISNVSYISGSINSNFNDDDWYSWENGHAWYESEKEKHLAFAGWCTTADGNGDWYVPGDRTTKSLILYPQWVDQPTSGYYYILQLGFDGEGRLGAIMAENGDAITAPDGTRRTAVLYSMTSATATVTLPNTDYHQILDCFYWAKNFDKDQAHYGDFLEVGSPCFNEGDSVTVSSSDVFTGIFGAAVNFYENKGSSNQLKKYRLIYTTYVDLTLPEYAEIFTGSDSTDFTGWKYAQTGKQPSADAETIPAGEGYWDYAASGDFYAQWQGGSTNTPTPTPTPDALSFTDVKPDDFFADAVGWAVSHQPVITNGTGGTSFSPNNSCSRAQIVTFLWRAWNEAEPSQKADFSDVSDGQFYTKAVSWAVAQGVTSGTGKGQFSPDRTCTRAEAVTFIWRAMGEPGTATHSSFSDVEAGQFYNEAVDWAVENNITSGTGGNNFSPNRRCTRGEIVTFLYRAMNNNK